MRKYLIGFLAVLTLTACAPPPAPDTPQQAVYAAKSAFAVALIAEIHYSNLPRCGLPASPIVCSEVSVIRKVQKARAVVKIALTEAQVAADTPGLGENKVTTAITAATALTEAYAKITETLEK